MDRQWRQYRDGSIQVLECPPISTIENMNTVASDAFLNKPRNELPPLIPQLENDDIDFSLDFDAIKKKKKRGLSLEESRKLLVGLTHSLKNTLCKLSLDHVLIRHTRSEQPSSSGSEKAVGSPETDISGASDGSNPVASISPHSPLHVTLNAGRFQSFSYKTNTYQLHYLETPSGWRFILQTPNPPLLQTTSKSTSKQKDMTKMLFSLTLSASSQSNEASSIVPSPPLVHVKMGLFYELLVEHIIRHPFYILRTDNSVFNRAGFLRIIDFTMQEIAKGEFVPRLD